MKVFVTGANGFLATNTIIELLDQGFKVIGLLRDRKKSVLPENINLELIEGDLQNTSLLEHTVQTCDCIIHIAAETRLSLIKYSDYYNINVTCTENLIQAALKHKLKKFVFVSTANTIGYGTFELPGTEENKIREPFSKSFYVQSKLEAQEIVLSKANEIHVVIVNPAFLIGPYDQKPSSGRIILMSYGKRIIFYPPGGKNFVSVFDAAKGVVSAMQKGKNRETYLFANENLTYREFFQKLSFVSNSKVCLIKIPKYLIYMIGIAGNILRFARIRNELIMTNMKILCINNFYSNKKARTELNVEFNPIDIALKDAIKWFNENKMIN